MYNADDLRSENHYFRCIMNAELFFSFWFAWQPQGGASAQKLETHVRALADDSQYRNHNNIRRLNETAEYIKTILEGYGYQSTFQEFTVEGKTYKNVVATLGPKTPNVMVMGAHYDVCFDTPGADDNASGVAGLLELARLLKENERHLKRTVELVFYTLEEPPHFGTENMGSAKHAQYLKNTGVTVDLMVSIEMIGRFSNAENSQQYPIDAMGLIYPTIGNFIAIVGRLSERGQIQQTHELMNLAIQDRLPIQSLSMPSFIQGVSFSDHYQYWDQGFPALMVTDTAFLRNHDYHTREDTADKLDYQKMSFVVDGLLQLPFRYQVNKSQSE